MNRVFHFGVEGIIGEPEGVDPLVLVVKPGNAQRADRVPHGDGVNLIDRQQVGWFQGARRKPRQVIDQSFKDAENTGFALGERFMPYLCHAAVARR
ncbi:MAG: hypothetical protein JWR40_645 [Massilia sp.]|nr:hypothetical protein [Massilia sp.]MDB5951630.1 hypothetical protein [Massilia sp.]